MSFIYRNVEVYFTRQHFRWNSEVRKMFRLLIHKTLY